MKKKYLLMYDVKDAHQYIQTELISQGWHSIIEGQSLTDGTLITCYLPETTWWKEFYNVREGWEEFQTIAGTNNILRLCITLFEDSICTVENPMERQLIETTNLRQP